MRPSTRANRTGAYSEPVQRVCCAALLVGGSREIAGDRLSMSSQGGFAWKHSADVQQSRCSSPSINTHGCFDLRGA